MTNGTTDTAATPAACSHRFIRCWTRAADRPGTEFYVDRTALARFLLLGVRTGSSKVVFMGMESDPLDDFDSAERRFVAMRARWLTAFEELNDIADRSLRSALNRGSTQSHKTKRQSQHFVPKFWLKEFVQDGHVAVLDTSGPATACVAKGIKSVACQDDFYTMATLDSEHDRWVEKYLEWLENLATRPEHGRWTNLVQGKMVADPLDRLLVAQLLTTQYFRTPRFMEMLRGAAEQVGQRLVETGQPSGAISATSDPLKVELNMDANREWLVGQFANLMTGHELPRQLFMRRWGLYESPDATGWALPVNNPIISAEGTTSLFAPEIWVPISRQYILCMHWDHDVPLPEERTERLHPPVADLLREATICNDDQLIVHPDDATAWQEWCDTDPFILARRTPRE